MVKKIANAVSTRLSLCVAAVFLIGSIFVPWWGMRFIAPQYPEGLDIIVYPYKLDGRIDIINGLNHYIGMKDFSEETFPELKFLPFIIVGMALLLLLAAWIRKKGFLYLVTALFVIGGGLGLYDIQRWLHSFGTELDPHAPIKLMPFVPPMIGENRIANFITHSYFSYGALLLGIVFLIVLTALWRERVR